MPDSGRELNPNDCARVFGPQKLGTQLTSDRRQLTEGELFILRLIQEAYGFENTEDEVFIGNSDEVVIFVRGEGTGLGVAVLTSLAESFADMTISSVEELKREWLLIDDS